MKNVKLHYTCNKNESIFYIGFGLFMLSSVLDLALYSTILSGEEIILYILKILRYLSYLICVIKIFFDGVFSKRRIGSILVVTILTVLGYFGSLNKTMILYAIVLIAAEHTSSRCVIKISFILQALILTIMVMFSQMGIIDDYIWEPDIRPRHFLGFSWVTTSAILYFFILLEYIYLKNGKLTFVEFIILFGIDIWFYHMTDSRMAFLLSAAFLTFFFLMGKYIQNGGFTIKIRKLLYISPGFIAAFAIALHVAYDSSSALFVELNDLLSGRLRLGNQAIKDYGISLFGQKIEWVGFSITEHLKGNYNYVDCSYVQILVEYGPIFLLIVIILYSAIIKGAVMYREYHLCWIILFILGFSITEPRLVNLAYNPFPILCITETSMKSLNNKQ